MLNERARIIVDGLRDSAALLGQEDYMPATALLMENAAQLIEELAEAEARLLTLAFVHDPSR